ncbi:PAS domain-containing sensor histidine kinase [Tichowtungia aerotolerans]|uniref:histidine kinase n=1 Tax=Tichowtungia aerotolerans TaxID=2697043 RepID=A0A6P1M8K5_9BACT|nr:PAS domain-containing sensor histidine kinase [Tichowtungia aerotolerans]QHI68448.1 GHKL domain-containing protein [Tichowtungia aerotolerans]
MAIETEFAPAERAPGEEVERQYRMLAGLPFVREFLDAVPNMTIVLNGQRQIVFANNAFRTFAGVVDEVDDMVGARHGEVLDCSLLSFLGKRPGEAAGCIRSGLTDGGCGTTVFCRTCGAVRAILNSQGHHLPDVQECRMLCGEEGEPLDLRVWCHPVTVNDEVFTVFSVLDISDEKRRKVLERIFFHDVLNTAGGLKGLADLLIETGLSRTEMKDIASMLSESSQQLVEEIRAQQMLVAAEHGDLDVSVEEIHSLEIMCRIIRQFHSVGCAEGKELIVSADAEHFEFVSDPVLVRRVLINLTQNALEAIRPGGTVTLNCFTKEDRVCFSVHNSDVIPLEIQRQLFTRSFSTKGIGRGLGTYSIKLIAEKYLKGKVSFVSDEESGTLFTVCYPRRIEAFKKEKVLFEVTEDVCRNSLQ